MTIAHDPREVDEDVLTSLGRLDEPEALLVIERVHDALLHRNEERSHCLQLLLEGTLPLAGPISLGTTTGPRTTTFDRHYSYSLIRRLDCSSSYISIGQNITKLLVSQGGLLYKLLFIILVMLKTASIANAKDAAIQVALENKMKIMTNR